MDIKRNILLNPGPATTSDTVKLAQVVQDICPRETEFGAVMEFISKELTNFVGTNDKYTTILFGGSGTAAVESMISSVIENEIILIINNGAYGKRMCEMAEIYNLNYIEFKASPIEEISFLELEEIIKEHNEKIPTDIYSVDNEYNISEVIEFNKSSKCINYKDKLENDNLTNNKKDMKNKKISHIALVHHETTTGILNDIKNVGRLCKEYKIDMIVDAMSSFAGIPIDMEKMNIKYLASSSNKCIQGMAGVSFVIANKESLESTKNIKSRNLYLNLYKQYSYFKDNYQMRFTPPVQVLYALKQAIIETKEETIEKRHERYKTCCKKLWTGLDYIGLKRLVSDKNASMLLTSIIEPEVEGYDFNEMHDYLYKRGFTIYPGKVSSKNTFRIANIGKIYPDDIERFIDILKEYLELIP